MGGEYFLRPCVALEFDDLIGAIDDLLKVHKISVIVGHLCGSGPFESPAPNARYPPAHRSRD